MCSCAEDVALAGSYKLAALGVRNVMNRAPTLAEGWFAMAFGVIKFLYKYCFSLPCVTHWLSTTTLWRSKTYCFALQKRRFCKVKAAVLQRKTYAFGKRKKNTRFSVKIFQESGGAKCDDWRVGFLGCVPCCCESAIPTKTAARHCSGAAVVLLVKQKDYLAMCFLPLLMYMPL